MPETETVDTAASAPPPATEPAPPKDGPASTTLDRLRGDQGPALTGGEIAGFTNAGSFVLLQRAARMLSESTLIPDIYRGNMPNCAIALEMAQRLGASALMVMQNLYVVYGRPAWSSQFVIACINDCRRFSALQYEWAGTPGQDSWACRAWATEVNTGSRVIGPWASVAIAKAEGWYDRKDRSGNYCSKWRTIPELMLMYRAAGWFGRTHAPELTMGLRTREEEEEIIDVDQIRPGVFAMADLKNGKSVASGPVAIVGGERVNTGTGEVVESKKGAKRGKSCGTELPTMAAEEPLSESLEGRAEGKGDGAGTVAPAPAEQVPQQQAPTNTQQTPSPGAKSSRWKV